MAKPLSSPKIFMRRVMLTSIATATRIVASIGMLAILARSVSLEFFAALAMGLLFGQILAILIDGGVNNEMLRFVGVDTPEDYRKRLDESTAVRLLMIPAPIAVIYAVAIVTGDPQTAQLLTLAAASAVLGSIGESYFMSFRAAGRHREELSCTMLLAILMVTLPWMAQWWPPIAGFCLLIPRALSLVNLIGAPRNTLIGAIRRHCSLRAIGAYYHRIQHYSVDSIVSNLSVQFDAILITLILGKQAYALYQPTSRLYVSSLSVASIVAGLFVPAAARKDSPLQARRYLQCIFSVAGVAVGAMLLPLLLFGVGPIFGSQFQMELPVAILLAITVVMRFVAAGSGSFLTLQGHQQRRTWGNVATSAIILPPTLLFASSVEAVLIALLLSQVLMAILYAVQSFRCT